MSQLKQLTLESLAEYDQGSLAVIFDRALRSIFLDLDDRPRLGKSRKVSIELDFKPEESDGDLLDAICSAKVKLSIPDKESRTNILAASHKGGGLMFNPESQRAAQATLPFEDGNDESC